MSRAAFLSLVVTLATMPAAFAQEGKPAATAPVVVAPAKVEPAAYYPPPGSLQAPLTAAEVCRSLRAGLSGAEVAQDVRERGLVGTFGEDEAADARAAGATPELIAALRAGRFTVSPAYARRYAEQSAKGRHAVESNAWRAEASARAQADERENERRRQGQIASENGRAIAAKEWEDKRRFQEMKDKADWESRQRQAYNANDGYTWHGHWYKNRYWSDGAWRYY